MDADPALEEFWALVRRPRTDLDPELTDEFFELAINVRKWLRDGDNHLVREAEASIQKRLPGTDDLRHGVLSMALAFLRAIAFEVDDPEYLDEPFAFRCWRTVEYGYTVMDQRVRVDPNYRVYPRKEYGRTT